MISRSIVLIVYFLTCAQFSYGDCASSNIRVFPSGTVLRQNPILVIEGYGLSQKIITGLNKEYPIYLEGENKRVNLIVKETLVGQFQLTQAVLQPTSRLDSGCKYTLVIDNLPPGEKLTRYDSNTRTWNDITFSVIPGNDTLKPLVTGKPSVIRKSYIHFGCGPQKWVVFNCPVSDSSDIMVRTTVKDLHSGMESTYILDVINGSVIVGQDMCSGAFKFIDGQKYAARFCYMDSSGNLTAVSDEINFISPVPDDGEGE